MGLCASDATSDGHEVKGESTPANKTGKDTKEGSAPILELGDEDQVMLKSINKVQKRLVKYLVDDLGSPKSRKSRSMSKVTMRQLFRGGGSPRLDKKLESDLFEVLDKNNDGKISLQEFGETIKKLSGQLQHTPRYQDGNNLDHVAISFSIFDTDFSGNLSFDEFRTMLKATMNARLILVLRNSTGFQFLVKFMKKELNAEHVHFWKDVESLEKLTGDEFREKAVETYKVYIVNDQAETINISAGERNVLVTHFSLAHMFVALGW
eukprot:CAMPEP_0170168498 /NCGR_PEP_ID=MMETSP0040_2-20121228/1513_1 /TAXON_ID=641309 /ORGANISM="Lotharella oceanica, Strain CCMP622" /LENGTH=264 /DNA_ID=CAMNT_0010406761 /DNA_START=15 /DNA_END=806 /DNA_ORIENTATION=+